MKTYRVLKADVVLGDEYKVFPMYVYIVDGVIKKSPIEGTISQLKAVLGAKEIRRCSIFGYPGASIGDRVL